MSLQPSNRFTNRLNSRAKDRKDKRGRILSGTGPIGKIMIYFIEEILIENIIKRIYNLFIDTLTSCFNFVQNTFFSDFKGFLAGKLKSKNGTCFEYTFFRYFMTLMLPPMGVFLSRGISSWYNILICGLLCFIKYFPGLIYALIVMQNAPYSKRYQEMKRDKLAKSRAEENKDRSAIEIEYTPLLIFIGAILITMLAVYISINTNPLQSVIGNPLNNIKNIFNNQLGLEKGQKIKSVISTELKNQISSDIKTKAISKFI
jgi:uncharacterized membrane protein YqaE (UPF0057 family)